MQIGNLGDSSAGNKFKMYYIIAPLVGALIGVIIFYIMRSGSSSAPTQPLSNTGISPTVTRLTPGSDQGGPAAEVTISSNGPEVVTNEFYSWYIYYPGDPFKSGAYKRSTHLTSYYVNLISEFTEAYDDTTQQFDPIFCKKNKELGYVIGLARYNEDKTQADVIIRQKTNNRELYRVVLIPDGSSWKIKDIMCRP